MLQLPRTMRMIALDVWRLVGVAVLLAACGDNSPPRADLAASDDLVIVAHQDDDLLFMQPDLIDRMRAQHPVTIVYVTAGDGGYGLSAANDRYHALMAAYGLALGATDWSCNAIAIGTHTARQCRLDAASLSLVFLGVPDGGVAGNYAGSLLSLWDAQIPSTTTIADEPTSYTRDSLVATLGAIITATRPKVIRTLDMSATNGVDHADHMMVGAITALAVMHVGFDAEIVGYRGYNTNGEPETLSESLYDDSSFVMRAYEACMTGCGTCGETACPTLGDGRFRGFAHRRYAVGTRRPPLTATLEANGGCIGVDAKGNVALVDCSAGTAVTFEPGGNIRVGSRCLAIQDSGALATAACGAGPRRDFLLDQEGHIFTGVLAPPGGDMTYDHTTCLVADGGAIRAARCGAALDWRWDLITPAESTPRDALGITATGRAIQISDLTGNGRADLCAVEADELHCALGDGAGGFAPATTVAALPIQPDSLSLGDVDGDGLPDACGLDADGVLCATAASGYVAQRWSFAFASANVTDATDETLGVVDHAVCGRSSAGVVCATRKATALYSRWPTAAAAVWPADLDGDGQPDWCTATADGPACGLYADHHITDEGVSWGFSMLGAVEGSAATDGAVLDVTRATTGDISGDGRADLCMVIGARVECALSQGRGFGPRRLALELPRGTAIQALWLGDVNGDGKADPCVDDGTAITCAPSP